MTFIKILKGYPTDIENEINAMVRRRNLEIVSVSSCINQGTLYVTVVFRQQDAN